MSSLANRIEAYIKRLLAASPNSTLVLQRKELAERFRCVPSQINYVLSTRLRLNLDIWWKAGGAAVVLSESGAWT